jgi:hypothetical protein
VGFIDESTVTRSYVESLSAIIDRSTVTATAVAAEQTSAKLDGPIP